MSYRTAKWITLGEKTGVFSSGYVDNTQNLYLGEGYSPYLRNARLIGNSTKIRPGHQLFSLMPGEEIVASNIADLGNYVENIRSGSITAIGEAFTSGVGYGDMSSVDFYGFKFGVPTGNITAYLYAVTGTVGSTAVPTGAALATSNTVDIATLPDITGKDWINFTFGAPYTIADNTDYALVVEYTGGDVTNFLRIGTDQTSTFAGNGVDYNGGWTTYADDINFRLYCFSSDSSSTEQPLGIGSYLRTDPDNSRIVVRYDVNSTKGLTVFDTDGSYDVIDTGANLASSNRMNFLNIADVIYCMNGSDDFGKLSGTTYTTPATGIANFSPSFGVAFSGSHWASGWSDNPNIVYKSVGDDYEDFNSAGSDSFSFQETITGLSENDQSLLVFTKNSISTIDLGDFDETNGIITYRTSGIQSLEGSVNYNSIVTVGLNTFFVTPSNKICIIRRGNNIEGFEVQQLSERKYAGISKIMGILDLDQSDSFGYFLPKDNIIKWYFKSYGSTYNDIIVVYDITKDAFLIDGQQYYYGGIDFKGKNYTISMLESKVYEDENGQDDEDSPIPFEYWTKEFYISDPTYKKILWETRTLLSINDLTALVQEIRIDGALKDSKTMDIDNYSLVDVGGIGTEPIGEHGVGMGVAGLDRLRETYILRTKGNLNIKGKKVQFRYRCNTLAAQVILKNISMKVEVLPEIATSLTL